MRLQTASCQFTAMFLIATVCAAQTPAAAPPNPAKQVAGTITVAQGTSIPLTLVNPVKSKSTKPGDAVRALVAFPITVGSQQAIPAGTYVEGTVASVTARAPRTHLPSMQIHFTRLVFANGYTAPLDGVNTATSATPIESTRAPISLQTRASARRISANASPSPRKRRRQPCRRSPPMAPRPPWA